MADKTTTPKKAAAAAGGKAKKAKAVPTHPPSGQMVLAAVTALKERKGSSLSAIKKYIATTYKVDSSKKAVFIVKAVRKAVADGKLVQVKGSFKLPQAEKKKSAAAGKKAGRPKKPAGEAKKAKTPKKAKVVKKKAATPKKKATTPKKKKTPKKAAAKKPKAKTTAGKKAGRPKKN